MFPSLDLVTHNFISDLDQIKLRSIHYCSYFDNYKLWGSLWNISEFYQSLIENLYVYSEE